MGKNSGHPRLVAEVAEYSLITYKGYLLEWHYPHDSNQYSSTKTWKIRRPGGPVMDRAFSLETAKRFVDSMAAGLPPMTCAAD